MKIKFQILDPLESYRRLLYLVLGSGFFLLSTQVSWGDYYTQRCSTALIERNFIYSQESEFYNFIFNHRDPTRVDFQSVAKGLQKRVSDYSWNPFYHLEAGACHYYQEDLQRAETFFEQALSLGSSDLGRLWVLAREFKRFALSAWEIRCFQQLQLRMLTEEHSQIPWFAEEILKDFVQSFKERKYEEAQFQLSWAEIFDPQNPFIQYYQARLRWALHQPGSFRALGHFLKVWWMTPRHQVWIGLSFFSCLYFVAMFCLIVVIVQLIIKYLYSFFHNLQERLPRVLPDLHKKILITMLSGTILVLGIQWWWLGFFILLFLWPFLLKGERKAVIGYFVFLFFLPVLIHGSVRLALGIIPDQLLHDFLRAGQGGWDSEIYSRLVKKGKNLKGERAFFAGLLQKKNGKLEEAEKYYRLALKEKVSPARIYLNLGNLCFLQGNLDEAEKLYRESLQEQPFYETYYNLSQIALEKLDIQRYNQMINLATGLNRHAIQQFTQQNSGFLENQLPLSRKVIDWQIRTRDFWKWLIQLNSQAYADQIWSGKMTGTSLNGLVFLALGGSLILFMQSLALKKKFSEKTLFCELCGKAICRRCSRGKQCLDCFEGVTKVLSAQLRGNTEKMIVHKKKRKGIILALVYNLLLPGAGQLYLRRVGAGFSLLIVSALFVFYLKPNGQFFSPYPLAIYEKLHFCFFWIIFSSSIVYYLTTNLIFIMGLRKQWRLVES